MPLTTAGYQVICSRSISKYVTELIIMIPITEEEEKELDSGLLVTKKGDFTFTIEGNNIICYGEIDFNTNSDDYYVLEDMRWLEHLTGIGICVPADYNYKEHTCYSPIRHTRYFDTTNSAIVAQYKHAVLGKPQRCCIFKEVNKHGYV